MAPRLVQGLHTYRHLKMPIPAEYDDRYRYDTDTADINAGRDATALTFDEGENSVTFYLSLRLPC